MAFRRDCNDRTQALSRVDVAFFNHAIDDFGDCADRIAGQNSIGREAAIILNGYVFRTCEDLGDLATSELLPGTQNAGEYLQRHDGGGFVSNGVYFCCGRRGYGGHGHSSNACALHFLHFLK